MKPKISIIVAGAKHSRIIGTSDNSLPWPRIKGDMQHFRAITIGNPIIMGRVTFETFPFKDGFPSPLPNRTNIVVTRNLGYKVPEGVIVVNSIIEALEKTYKQNPNRICIIGGQQIYELTLPIADEIFYTEINLNVEGTTYFPAIPDSFRLLESKKNTEETTNGLIEYDIQYWVRS